ncbi:hypothetical protein C1Y41_04065 [Pantoea sp. ICBG 1758]|nr:hypothetical protein C1Y41_04065 [Pantoea sp. ICBG 1758]
MISFFFKINYIEILGGQMESTDYYPNELISYISHYSRDEIALINFLLANADRIHALPDRGLPSFTVVYPEFRSFLLKEFPVDAEDDTPYLHDGYFIDGVINSLSNRSLGDYRFITNRIFNGNALITLSIHFSEFLKKYKGLKIDYKKSGLIDSKFTLSDLYNDDFHGWVMENVGFLKTHRFDKLDLNNLINEFMAIGNAIESILEWRLGILIYRLMLWNHGIIPTRENLFSIECQIMEIQTLLNDNKSLLFKLRSKFIYRAWSHARFRASFELNIKKAAIQSFPEWELHEIMNPHKHPELFSSEGDLKTVIDEIAFEDVDF